MTILPLSSQIAPKMSGSSPSPLRGTSSSQCQCVEIDAKLEMLLDDVLDRDRRLDLDAPSMGVFAESRASASRSMASSGM